ncbi:MAG: beta-N-acetylhexosaminidase [Bdellovibrionota bacterium]
MFNRRTRSLIALSLAALVGVVISPANAKKSPAPPTKVEPAKPSYPKISNALSEEDEALIASLPLGVKVGQMMMIGFMGDNVDYSLKKIIERVHPGAIVVFSRNIKTARQISDLNREAQAASMRASSLPLLIACDQEGGDVVRLKTPYQLPSALAFGIADDVTLAEKAGVATGQLMKALGFNMNLAPVLDVADPKAARFIGTRSFGKDPKLVAKLGRGFAAGLDSAGVLPTTKHFPGHGGVSEDSHLKTPTKDDPLAQLEQLHIAPFEAMRAEFTSQWAVMLAHVAYPALDPSKMPATFSKPIVTDLLRKKLAFDGLVVTDDIEMAGASVVADINERAVRAVEAGVDLIMVAWNKKMMLQVSNSLIAAVKSGRISEERINESLRRIVSAKRKYADPAAGAPSLKELRAALQNPAFREIADATVAARLKVPPSDSERTFLEESIEKPILLFSASPRFTNDFTMAVAPRTVRPYRITLKQSFDIDKVMRSNPASIGVFYASGPLVAKIGSRISADVASRMILVTVEAPGSIENADDFKALADVYYRHPELGNLIGKSYFSAAPEVRTPASKKKQNKKPKKS